MKNRILSFMLIFILSMNVSVFAQKPYRIGTTSANFLEIGFGSSGNAMADAVVSTVNDLSAIYWNPGRLGYLRQNEVQFMYQPWFADIHTNFSAIGFVIPRIGTVAAAFYQVNYGDIDVTSTQMQDGTGEQYSANDYCASLSYGRNLVEWFSFGASFKYIGSKIWHSTASAIALDLGVVVNTHFFSPTGNKNDGLTIGMSIANYGTKLRYDGMDLMQPIDLYPYEEGNYKYAEGKFNTQGWELPLIFRIGAAIHPIASSQHRFTLEADALHPNNNSESVNVGAQYEIIMPTFGSFFLRGGYKALFMEDSEYGVAFGGGFISRLMDNFAFKIDYAYRDIGVLGATHAYTVGFLF